ncbi:hypothetical protein BTZ20_2916 [Rhodococcus sp. MTM3W5.2]|nr:hypothetical protein BTZ20_2916 [Rhodococcus sp. MTM3W5.2]
MSTHRPEIRPRIDVAYDQNFDLPACRVYTPNYPRFQYLRPPGARHEWSTTRFPKGLEATMPTPWPLSLTVNLEGRDRHDSLRMFEAGVATRRLLHCNVIRNE